MTLEVQPSSAERLAALHERMARSSLAGHWQERRKLPDLVPWRWRWADVYECLIESGEVVRLGEDTFRRTVQLINPALTDVKATSRTIQMSVQLVKPGEIAECHRHTAAALRFIVQGQGAYTAVEGERFHMAPGDLVLTPHWTWHDHANYTDEPIIWLDVLDIHLERYLAASFFELYAQETQPISKPDGVARAALGLARRPMPAGAAQPEPAGGLRTVVQAPPFNYKWSETLPTLEALASQPGDPYDGVLLEYTNPLTGGHTMPTINCQIQLLRPGEATRAHRHTGVTIYHVVRGQGVTTIDEQELDWGARDGLIVPSWRWHAHRNLSSSEPAILFSVSDRPAIEAVGLYREEGQ